MARSPLTRVVRTLACALGVGWVLTASAQSKPPTARSKHEAGGSRGPIAATMPGSATALAYMAGHQGLVGWHAASTKPVDTDATGRPMLSLTTINHGESLSIAAASYEGGFAAVDLDRMAHLLRSAGGEEHPVDPRTLALVYRIQQNFQAPEIRVVSGYRIPRPGSHSNHGKGRAIDLIVPGVPDEEVAKFARGLGFVGVGVYPTSQFVHVDIRPRSYFWVDYTGPHMKNKESCILPGVATEEDAAAAARGQSPIEPFRVSLDVDAALRARGAAPEPVCPDEEDDED